MGQSIETQIEIDAPAAEVWATFSAFDEWPEWNPYLRSLKGTVAVGQKIEVRLDPPGGKAMTFKPNVTEFDAGQRFHWLGKLMVSGIFDGEHQFIVESMDGGRTRFTQREEFGGVLVGLILRKVRGSTTAGFEAMNQALKERVEKKSAEL